MAHKRTIVKRILACVAIALVALVAAGAWYVNDYYHADAVALDVMADADGDADGVVVRKLSDKAFAFVPTSPKAGFVFYPGAKVQPEAYAPLLKQCASRGVLCVLVRPIFNLALFDADAVSVDDLRARFPEVKSWVIGGHSMGGLAACDHASRHEGDFAYVALLASYPNTDLTSFAGGALSVVGSKDGVLNRKNYEAARDKLPRDAREVVIDGGNHANFGNYGDQGGDGTATISREEQQERCADAIAAIAQAA
ncbi:MAG: hypothetical protein J6D54_04090 [Olsenella sp.]|nr:hypothetical protein [Olsenella sp.]